MFILGKTFLGFSDLINTPTHSKNVTSLTIENAEVDVLHIENIPDKEHINNEYWAIQNFGWNTILSTDFNNNSSAGNIDWLISNISAVYVKMRKKGDFQWITIATHKINKLDDFSFGGVTFLNQSKTPYEIAFVPIINGEEGAYNIHEIYSDFNQIALVDKDVVYSTTFVEDFMDTQRTNNTIVSQGMYNKYPYFYKISECNYDTGTVNACWSELDCSTNEFNYDLNRINRIKDRLCSGNPMLLKHFDGRNILITVTDAIEDSGKDDWRYRLIKFNWVEIGNAESEEDLYNNGITNISHEYFSQSY